MSYQLAEDLQKKAISVSQVCRVLDVSRSCYHAAAKRRQAPPRVCTECASEGSLYGRGCTYDSRRMRTVLNTQGVTMGRHRMRSLMRTNGLRPVWRRKFVHTTDSKHSMPVSNNVLARQFDRALPNQAWVCDITYIRTRSGWLYLAAVLDLHSRKIVGWAMAPEMPATLVCAALQMAIVQRNPNAGLIVHSDRGTQYASAEHQALLKKHGLVGSMSRKGNCWDIAVMERFFLNLKMERAWQKDFANNGEAMADVADYIVGFYNCKRLHCPLGNLSPNALERESAKQQPIDVSEKA